MYPNLDLGIFTLFTIYFNCCGNSFIHSFNQINYPLLHPNMSQSPPYNITWHSIKCLLQVHKGHPQLFLFSMELFLDLTHNKIAYVVPFPRLNPNCISSNFTIFLTRASITLSSTFKT